MPENSRPDTPRVDLIEVAAKWLAGLDAGTADVRAFEAWREADARHAAAFAQVAGTWSDLGELRHLPDGAAPAPLGHSGLAAPAPEAGTDDGPEFSPTTRNSRRRFLRTGLALGAVALGGAGVTYRAAARDSASTGVGESGKVACGSAMAIDLNTDSRIYWKEGEPLRLWLERGEVAIHLASAHRLSLITQGGTFQLAPGYYNARIRNASCELTVLAGSGRFGAQGRALAPGVTALATAGKASLRKDADELDRVTAWRNGTLILTGESLDYALSEMNRYLEHKIVIGDPGLSRLRIGGTFATANPEEFLEALRTSFAIRTHRDAAGGIVLTRA